MMSLGERATSVALSYLGVGEQPPGSNRGPEVDEFLRHAGLDPSKGAYPWCAAFVGWCVHRAGLLLGVKPMLRPSARCITLLQRNPEAQLDRIEPFSVFVHLQPNTDGHVGFVVETYDDGSFLDVSGNSDRKGSRTGGSVCQNVRPAGYAQAFLAVR